MEASYRPADDEPEEIEGPSTRFRRSLAVIIGIDSYTNGIDPLRSAVADAKAIAQALERDHGFETRCLFDEEADRARWLRLLHEELPAALGPDDRLLFYFAGHGIALESHDGPAGYLLPADACRNRREGFLPMSVLHEGLEKLAVRHALIILDCCFAGAFRWSSFRDIEPGMAKLYRERYERYVECPAWQVLTSASSDQLALDVFADTRGAGTHRHSPFASALLDALSGSADYTKDHVLTADELALFVRSHVAPAAEAMGRSQVPQLFPLARHDAGQFVFQVPRQALALEAAPALDDDANPYRGLQSFREQDRGLFFGRAAAAERLVEAIAARQLTVVVGPSGCGKSSLVQAGALSALRARGWDVLPTQRPGRAPLAVLEALARELSGGPAEVAPGDPAAAWRAAAAARAKLRPDTPWVVVIDQLEELITHRQAERDQGAFLGALAESLDAHPSLRLIATVRADAEPQLHDSALGARWTAARFVIPPASRAELRAIIEQPAIAKVLHFEPPHLAERLIDEVALLPAPLPLLSFALSELYRCCWERWQAGIRDRALRESDYDELGSVARALTRRATALHDELVAKDAAYATTIRNIFHRMIALAGVDRARRRVSLDELSYDDPAENRRTRKVLQAFHDARLISLGSERAPGAARTEYAEPTHDELVRGWPLVSRWLDEMDTPPGTRALLAAVGRAARSWQQGKQATALLWGDSRAEQARVLAGAQPFVFNAVEKEFIARSVRRRRGVRTVVIGVTAVFVSLLMLATAISLGLRGLAVSNEKKARVHAEEAQQQRLQSQQLYARSVLEMGRARTLEGRYVEAVPYLVEARSQGETGSALQMLFATAASHLPERLFVQRTPVQAAALSADGARIAVASAGTVRLWDHASERELRPLQSPNNVSALALSADGTRAATASGDSALLWSVDTGQPLSSPLRHGASVEAVVLGPKGELVVTVGGPIVRVWDASGKPLLALSHGTEVIVAAVSPDGALIVTAGEDRTARIWDATTGARLGEVRHHESVVAVAFSPDSKRFVTASHDDTARIWDAATGEGIPNTLSHDGDVTSASFSPNGARVITTSADRTARIWDAATGRQHAALKHDDAVSRASFSANGQRVITASGRAVRVWDVEMAQLIEPVLLHEDFVLNAVLDSNGERAITTSQDRTTRVWKLDTASHTTWAAHSSHGKPILSAMLSYDGEYAVTASEDGTARIRETAHPKSSGIRLQHKGAVNSVAFSLDEMQIVTASSDGTARIWNATDGSRRGEPLRHGGHLNSAVFSPDGTQVVTAGRDKTARIWHLTSSKLPPPLAHGDSVTSARFSPDGKLIATASDDHTARIWVAATGVLQCKLPHDGSVRSVAFSPDGTRLLTASNDRHARLWDPATCELLKQSIAHEDAVTSAAFSVDGACFVTASDDGTARVWDGKTGDAMTVALNHGGHVTSAAFDHDGGRVITSSADRTARIWDARSGQLLHEISHHAEVRMAAFDGSGRLVMTVSGNHARITNLPLDTGDLATWEALAKRSPFELVNGALVRRR